MSTLSKTSFRLLSELGENNNREWFEKNKSAYQENVREPFADLLESLSQELSSTGMAFSGSEKTMFRVNRDVRFSHDKSPYNTHVSGVLTPSGTKSESSSLIYVHLDAHGGFAVAGLYHPQTERLDALRAHILENESRFADILHTLAESGLTLDTTEATKNMPRAFAAYADHPLAAVIKLKNMMVRIEIPKNEWLGESLIPKLAGFANAARPLLEFLDDTTS